MVPHLLPSRVEDVRLFVDVARSTEPIRAQFVQRMRIGDVDGVLLLAQQEGFFFNRQEFLVGLAEIAKEMRRSTTN